MSTGRQLCQFVDEFGQRVIPKFFVQPVVVKQERPVGLLIKVFVSRHPWVVLLHLQWVLFQEKVEDMDPRDFKSVFPDKVHSKFLCNVQLRAFGKEPQEQCQVPKEVTLLNIVHKVPRHCSTSTKEVYKLICYLWWCFKLVT